MKWWNVGLLRGRKKMIDRNSTKEEVLEAIKLDGSALQYASDKLRNDREIVLEATRWNWKPLRYAGDDLLREVEMCWREVIAREKEND